MRLGFGSVIVVLGVVAVSAVDTQRGVVQACDNNEDDDGDDAAGSPVTLLGSSLEYGHTLSTAEDECPSTAGLDDGFSLSGDAEGGPGTDDFSPGSDDDATLPDSDDHVPMYSAESSWHGRSMAEWFRDTSPDPPPNLPRSPSDRHDALPMQKGSFAHNNGVDVNDDWIGMVQPRPERWSLLSSGLAAGSHLVAPMAAPPIEGDPPPASPRTSLEHSATDSALLDGSSSSKDAVMNPDERTPACDIIRVRTPPPRLRSDLTSDLTPTRPKRSYARSRYVYNGGSRRSNSGERLPSVRSCRVLELPDPPSSKSAPVNPTMPDLELLPPMRLDDDPQSSHPEEQSQPQLSSAPEIDESPLDEDGPRGSSEATRSAGQSSASPYDRVSPPTPRSGRVRLSSAAALVVFPALVCSYLIMVTKDSAPGRVGQLWPAAPVVLPVAYLAGRRIGRTLHRNRVPPMPLGNAIRWRHTFPGSTTAGAMEYSLASVMFMIITASMHLLATWLTSFPRLSGVPFYPDRVAFVD